VGVTTSLVGCEATGESIVVQIATSEWAEGHYRLVPETVCGGMSQKIIETLRCNMSCHNVFQKKTPTHIIGYKLRSSCLILIIFDIEIPHII